MEVRSIPRKNAPHYVHASIILPPPILHVSLTLINPLWGIELPSNSLTKEGSIYEGNFFIQLRQRFKDRHPQLRIIIDLGDGHYDDEPSYNWCRGK